MNREQRIQWFKETLGLEDINKNKGKINCAHCALRLDTYISQGGTNGSVRPVPKASAKLFTHPTFDGSKIKRSYTNDKRVLDRTNLNALTAESLVVYDITSEKGEPILDLTFDDSQNTRKSSARLIRAERGVPLTKQLKGCQRRAKDGTAYGFVWLTHKNNTQDGHVINYFVDSAENNHEVYFLDAQLGRVVAGGDYFNSFHEDIFYLPTYPPEGFVIKKEPTPIIQVKLEKENIMKTEVDKFIEQFVEAVEQKDLAKLDQLKKQKFLGVRNSKNFSAMHILAMSKEADKAFNNCQWLANNSSVPLRYAASGAAYAGQKDLYIKVQGGNLANTTHAAFAAYGGHKDLVYDLIKEIKAPNTADYNQIAAGAIKGGHKTLANEIRTKFLPLSSPPGPIYIMPAPGKRPGGDITNLAPSNKVAKTTPPSSSTVLPAFFNPNNGHAGGRQGETNLLKRLELIEKILTAKDVEINALRLQVKSLQEQLELERNNPNQAHPNICNNPSG